MKSPYRDDFKIHGFRFGEGKKTAAIVGAIRGDEVQQFIASQIVKNLKELEEAGKLVPGNEILVIPSVNHFSMNINKRFWAMDNTDINRMFPGYHLGETTQRGLLLPFLIMFVVSNMVSSLPVFIFPAASYPMSGSWTRAYRTSNWL